MMDANLMSSMIDASLTFAGVIAVVMVGIATLSSESTTASAASTPREGSAAVENLQMDVAA